MVKWKERKCFVALPIPTTIPCQVLTLADIKHQAIRNDVLMAEHDAFWKAGCTRRVHQERKVVLGMNFSPTIPDSLGDVPNRPEVLEAFENVF